MNDNNAKSGTLNEALRRIEQAKLYEALLSHDLFSEDSASPEIAEIVRAEISEFIQTRLEVLLGIRQDSSSGYAYESPFEEEEIVALKALAARALNAPSRPSQPSQPTIIPVATQSKANKRGKTRKQEEPVQVRQKSNNTSQMAIERPDGTREIVETDYAQAVNPNNPPLKMPSQAEIDQMNARQADQNIRSEAAKHPRMGGVVNDTLSVAQRNPQIKEE